MSPPPFCLYIPASCPLCSGRLFFFFFFPDCFCFLLLLLLLQSSRWLPFLSSAFTQLLFNTFLIYNPLIIAYRAPCLFNSLLGFAYRIAYFDALPPASWVYLSIAGERKKRKRKGKNTPWLIEGRAFAQNHRPPPKSEELLLFHDSLLFSKERDLRR